MEVTVRPTDSIRLQNCDAKVFADLQSNTEQWGIDVTFYEFHRLMLIKKSNTFKMFAIPEEIPLTECDFGWWGDGEVVWKSEWNL